MLIEIFWIAYFANGFFLNYKKFCTSSPHLRHTWLSLCHSLCFAAPARACPKLPICASEHPRRWYPAPTARPLASLGLGVCFPVVCLANNSFQVLLFLVNFFLSTTWSGKREVKDFWLETSPTVTLTDKIQAEQGRGTPFFFPTF